MRLYAVQTRIKAGTLSTLPDGKLDWQTVQREWVENRDASKVRKTTPTLPTVDGSYLHAKTQREYVAVEREGLELALRKGEMAPLGEINAHVAGMVIRARDILIRMPAYLRDRLAQEKNPDVCAELITAEIERALAELSEFRPNAT